MNVVFTSIFSTSRLKETSLGRRNLIQFNLSTREKYSPKPILSAKQYPFATMQDFYFSSLPYAFKFILYNHLLTMIFLPIGNVTRSQALFLSRAPISSTMTFFHGSLSIVITQITKSPIIHIKNHMIIQRQETRIVDWITYLYYTKHIWVHTNIKTEPSSYLAQQPIIYDYKTVMNNYLSV